MIGNGNRMMYVRLDKGQDGCTVPLYERPKEWVGLTDEEIYEFDIDPVEAKRMIAKLKQKNNIGVND
jgi:hypothetical protein